MFLFAKEGLSTDDVGVAKGTTVFQELRPWAGFKTGHFVKENLGGATVERLVYRIVSCHICVYIIPTLEDLRPSTLILLYFDRHSRVIGNS